MLSPEQQLLLSDSANGVNKISVGETSSVTPPPRYSNREGCEVCQMGVTHSGAVETPRLRSWWQPLRCSPLIGQFITNDWCVQRLLHTCCQVFTTGDFCGCWSGNSYSTAASETTFFKFQEDKNALFSSTVKHITPGSCIVQQSFITSHWAVPLYQLQYVLCSQGASLLTNMLSRACADMHALPLCIIVSPSTFLRVIVDASTQIFQPINPLTCSHTPSLQLQTPSSPKASGGWESPLLVRVSITPTPYHHSQISSVKWKGLCHNTGIIPHSSGTTMRAVSPAYIIIPDICKFCVMPFFPP